MKCFLGIALLLLGCSSYKETATIWIIDQGTQAITNSSFHEPHGNVAVGNISMWPEEYAMPGGVKRHGWTVRLSLDGAKSVKVGRGSEFVTAGNKFRVLEVTPNPLPLCRGFVTLEMIEHGKQPAAK